jgi:hypothetical protein
MKVMKVIRFLLLLSLLAACALATTTFKREQLQNEITAINNDIKELDTAYSTASASKVDFESEVKRDAEYKSKRDKLVERKSVTEGYLAYLSC